MEMLAYVFITITAPPLYAGEVVVTRYPVECAASIDAFLETLEQNGFEADAMCAYTSAPAVSPLPLSRSLPSPLRG